jgi:gliding motility-associated-like protein
MRVILLWAFVFLFSLPAFSQLKLQLGEYYLPGENVKKLQVSPGDYTIWALTQDHKVFYKKEASANFQLYTPVSGMVINDLAGYNYDEMYFVVGTATLTRVKSGVLKNFTIASPLVTRINGIAIISPVYNMSAVDYTLSAGWLAIGTNDALYYMAIGSDEIISKNSFLNTTAAEHSDWSYMRSSFKQATFRYSYLYDNCGFLSSHINVNLFNYTEYVTGYADLPPNPSQVNTGLMSLHPMQLFGGGGYNYTRQFDFWGTNQGMYAQYSYSCSRRDVKNFFPEQVNGISEAYALSQIDPQHYIIAATDKGLQYTPSTVFGSDQALQDLSTISFTPFAEFPSVKATDVLVDSRKDDEPSVFVFVCDKVAWVSTVNGIYKVYLNYDRDKFKNIKAQTFATLGNVTPVYNSDGDAVFDRCDNTQVVSAGLLNHANNQLKISWFKDGVEILAWAGKQLVDLVDAGKYHAEITSLCEGVTVSSYNFILQAAPDPQITFNYNDNITLCQGQTFSFSTINAAGYSYKWYHDGELIPGAGGSSYDAALPGKYRVEVSSCGTYFKPSKTVTIITPVLNTPVITPGNSSYCTGDMASLSVINPNGNTVNWYFNGIELIENANKTTLATNKAGSYTVKFASGDCEKLSEPYTLTFNDPLVFQIIKSKEGALCYGQAVTLSSSAEASAYKWSTGETTRQIAVSSAGRYSLQLSSQGNCTSNQFVDILSLPPVVLPALNDTVICTIASETLRINAPPGFATYSWNGVTSSNAYLDVNATGSYTLQVFTADGCSATTTFNVTPWCKELIIPNVFSPNNDGVNDYWRIGGIEDDNNARIQLFNRYGARLVDFKGNGFAWDGRYKGVDLPVGTYYYIIKTKNEKDVLKGAVTIIR